MVGSVSYVGLILLISGCKSDRSFDSSRNGRAHLDQLTAPALPLVAFTTPATSRRFEDPLFRPSQPITTFESVRASLLPPPAAIGGSETNAGQIGGSSFNPGRTGGSETNTGQIGGSETFNPNGRNGGIDFSKAERTADGRLCVIKESEVESIAKDPILECTHKNVEKCHYTYVTQFESAQEEICEENFEKLCQITFKQQAIRETVTKCYKPQRKVCNGQGPDECRTVYESSCTTRYIEKHPGKFVGDTACEKLPVEICGQGCTIEEGPEECHDKEIDTLLEVPEEVCDLNPQKTCRFATKLVPKLKPKHECTTFPKEVCSLKFSSPRKEKKPLRSEWCLDESPIQPDQLYDQV